MDLVLQVLGSVAPVFLLAAVGFLWVRALGWNYDVEFVTRLAMSLSIPCLIFMALVRSDVDCEKSTAETRPQTGAGSPGRPGGQQPMCMMSASRRGVLTGSGQTIPDLAGALQAFLGRPVIDGTALQGQFDMDLKWTPNAEISAPPPGVPVLNPDGPSLLTAVQEQLGLRLDSTRTAFDVVVIERLERPTPD